MVMSFGEFCTYPQPPNVLYNTCYTQPFVPPHETAPGKSSIVQLNPGYMLQTLGALMTMYWHVNLLRACTMLPAEHWAE